MLNQLIKIAGAENIKENEPMSKHTTFKAGGNAAYFVEPNNLETLSEIVKYLNRENKAYYIIGNGSNVLVKDSGYNGVVVKISDFFNNISVEKVDESKYILEAGAGAMLGKVSKTAVEYSLTGMETLSGIPGTIGGAVVMNAGAYGGEIKDVILSAEVMDKNGNTFTLSKDELELSYRHSVIQEKEYIILKSKFILLVGEKEVIKSKMSEYAVARKEKQPLEYPSAGSTFKRPKGNFAGKLIMDAGLRGHRVGEAMVSEKHCGFVINKGNATATDILKVMEDVKIEVKKKFDVDLEPEIKVLG